MQPGSPSQQAAWKKIADQIETDDSHPLSIFEKEDAKCLSTPLPPALEAGEEVSTLAKCAALDHSDTDNAKRLMEYFPDQLLIMQASGVAGGDKLIWSGRHWDLDNGEAGAVLLAQQVGDFIQKEADFVSYNEAELTAINAGLVAETEIDKLQAVNPSRLSSDQTTLISQYKRALADARAAKRSMASRQRAHRKFGILSKNASRVRSMLESASPHLRKPIEAFNASALSVATWTHTLTFIQEGRANAQQNAVHHSARIEAVPGHRPSDLITALIPVTYDPQALAPRFRAWLERMMPDVEARRTLQQYTGVCLLGVPLQRFMFHYGEGANGKSVFLELIVRLLGKSFAVGLPTESIVGGGERNAGSASPDLIRLFGKRMVRVLELPEGKPLQSELIKKLTGGEEIPVRTLFKGFIDFMPRAKPHMSGNGLPKISDTSNGIWRRMLFLRWPVTIEESQMRDLKVMVSEFLEESSGILNWLCEGALDFLSNGLFIASSVAADVRDYRKEMDIVMQFVEDCIEQAPGESVQARTAYNAFKEWCAANSKAAIFEIKFGRDMKRHCKREDSRVRRYVNVRLRADRPRLSTVQTSSSQISEADQDDVVPFQSD